MKKIQSYFKPFELALWAISVFLIIVFSLTFKSGDALSVTASLVGATSLIFNAKGNPFGQLLMVIFSLLYGIISLVLGNLKSSNVKFQMAVGIIIATILPFQ